MCGASSSEAPPFTRGAFLGRWWVQHVNQGDAHDPRTRRSAGHLSHTLILAPCLMRDTENWFLGLADKSTPPVIITCSLITRRERQKIPFLRCQPHRTLPVWMKAAPSDSLSPSLALPSLLGSRPSLPPSSQSYLQANFTIREGNGNDHPKPPRGKQKLHYKSGSVHTYNQICSWGVQHQLLFSSSSSSNNSMPAAASTHEQWPPLRPTATNPTTLPQAQVGVTGRGRDTGVVGSVVAQ